MGRSVINISNHMETLLLNVLEAIYIFSFPLIMETWHKHREKSSFSFFNLYSFGIFIHIFIQYSQLTFLNLDVIFNICGVFSSSLSHHNFSFIPPPCPVRSLWTGYWIWALGSCRASIWGSAFIINQNYPKTRLTFRNTTLITSLTF